MNLDQAAILKERPVHHSAIEYLVGDSLSKHSVSMPKSELKKTSRKEQWGWAHLGKSKDTLKMPAPIAVLSIPQLIHKVDREGMNFWRPNVMYSSKSAKQRQLRWLTCFFFDFDPHHLKKLDLYTPDEICDHVIREIGVHPTLILQTPSRGYHVYLPLKRIRGMVNGEKTIPRYGAVMRHIARLIGSDIYAATPEHYMRVPKAKNVIGFWPTTHYPTLEDYEENLEIQNTTSLSTERIVEDVKVIQIKDYTYKKAIEMILSGNFQDGYVPDSKNTKKRVGRNNAAFTLSLAFKVSGYTEEEAEKKISVWHQSGNFNTVDFDLSEALATVRHAYESSCKGPSSTYLEALTGISCRAHRIITPRKPREERRDHLSEISQDVRTYLVQRNGDVDITQTELAKELGVALRSLVAVLKKMRDSKLIRVEKFRVGRTWRSQITLINNVQSSDKSNNQQRDLLEALKTIVDSRLESAATQHTKIASTSAIKELSQPINYSNQREKIKNKGPTGPPL